MVHVEDAPVRRLEDDDRIGLRVQRALELRLDRLGALLVFDVGERSNPGENLAGRASLRHGATEVPAKRTVGTLSADGTPTWNISPERMAFCHSVRHRSQIIGVKDSEPGTRCLLHRDGPCIRTSAD